MRWLIKIIGRKNTHVKDHELTIEGPAGWCHIVASKLSECDFTEEVQIGPKGREATTVYGRPMSEDEDE